jgi:hypothetical protein
MSVSRCPPPQNSPVLTATVARHQANHSRILALRAQDEALSLQLKSSITTLAQLRHELFETPATTFSQDSRPVPFEELLQFAKNISQHTVPPTYRERLPTDDTEKDKANHEPSSEVVSSNGLGTPALPTAPTGEPPKDPAAEPEAEPPKEVTAEQEEWLTKLHDSQISWYPWPSDHKIRSGNLMQIQHLLDQGKKPEEINIAEQAEEEKKNAEEEEQRLEAALTAQEPQMSGHAPLSGGPRPPQQDAPAVYSGFDDFDED